MTLRIPTKDDPLTGPWIDRALAAPISDIGQLTRLDRKALDAAVRSGTLAKWRGVWYPQAGASFGLGPLKTCYGTQLSRDALP